LTFADAAKNGRDVDSGRSRIATYSEGNIRAERLHLMITKWYCNPKRNLATTSRAPGSGHWLWPWVAGGARRPYAL